MEPPNEALRPAMHAKLEAVRRRLEAAEVEAAKAAAGSGEGKDGKRGAKGGKARSGKGGSDKGGHGDGVGGGGGAGGGGRGGSGPAPLHVVARPALLDSAFLSAVTRGKGKSTSARSTHRYCYSQPPEVGLAALLEAWSTLKAARVKATLTILSCAAALPRSPASVADAPSATRDAHDDANGAQGAIAGALTNPESSEVTSAAAAAEARRAGAAACEAATRLPPSAAVSVVSSELFGAELAISLASCAFDLIPVERPAAVQAGSLLRAQAAGAIPISTRHLESALPDTCGTWDLGPPPSNSSVARDESLMHAWLAAAIAAGTHPHLKQHRKAMRAWAARRYAQQDAPQRWIEAFARYAPTTTTATAPTTPTTTTPTTPPTTPPPVPPTPPPSPPPPLQRGRRVHLQPALGTALSTALPSSEGDPSAVPGTYSAAVAAAAAPDSAGAAAAATGSPNMATGSPAAAAARLVELEALVASEARDLAALERRVADLEAQMRDCHVRECEAKGGRRNKRRQTVAVEAEEEAEEEAEKEQKEKAAAEETALFTAEETALFTAEETATLSSPPTATNSSITTTEKVPPPPARLCWIVLLDRPGGVDAALQAARVQSSRAFRMVLLDRLHQSRQRAVARLVEAAGDLAERVQHVEAPRRAPWGAVSVWKLAAKACTEDMSVVSGESSMGTVLGAIGTRAPSPAIEVVAIVRQFIWMPPAFVEATLSFHSTAAAEGAVLAYPLWLYRAPTDELDDVSAASAKRLESRAQLLSPALHTSYSSRGWPLVRRLPPAATAPLPGTSPTLWQPAANLEKSASLPSGLWSLPLRMLEAAVAREAAWGVPEAPGPEADQCMAAAKASSFSSRGRERRDAQYAAQVAGATGTALYLATLSLLGEVVETAAWEPSSIWRYDRIVDGAAC